MPHPVLILGATSDIARAVAESFAEKRYPHYLASRDEEEIQRLASDLQARFRVNAQYGAFDVQDLSSHAAFFQTVQNKCGSLSGAVLAVGYLGD